MEKHKIRIIQNKMEIPERIFIDEKEIIGVDKINIIYSHDFNGDLPKKVEITLVTFDKLEIITQDV